MSRVLSETGNQLAAWREPGERIRQALSRDELTLYFQPIGSLEGGPGWVLPLEESLQTAVVLDRIREGGRT